MENKEKNRMKCWSFRSSAFRHPVYQLLLEIFLPGSESWIDPPIGFIVDTGYDGDLLLMEGLFKSLGFDLYKETPETWDIAETITGEELVLQTSRSEVRFDQQVIPVQIETFTGNTENLVGRGFLNRLLLVVNGFKQVCCLSREELQFQ